MDIKIEAPKHENQLKAAEFYTEKLTKKLGQYDFVKSIDVKVKSERGIKIVSLQFKPEKGKMIYASGSDESENLAFKQALNNIKTQIEKYKEVHYHSAHLANKEARRFD
jgi:ribosome-associated translation inhibitor RaiA